MAIQELFYKETNKSVTGTSGDDLIFADSAAALGASSSAGTINGGSGTDTLRIIAAAAGSYVLHSGVSNIETVEISQSLDNVAAAADRGNTAGINIDASAQASALTINGNDGANELKGGSATDTINGYGGDDILYGNGGVNTLDGGEGNDLYVITGTADVSFGTAGDDIIASAGTDKLVVGLSAGKTFTITSLANLGVEEVVLGAVTKGKLSADSTGSNLSAAAITTGMTLTGNAGVNAITGGSGDDTLTGGGGKDTLVGGSGTNVFVYNTPAELVSGESITGGTGTDTLKLLGTGAYKFSGVTLSGIEAITVGNGSAAGIDATGQTSALTLTGSRSANIIIGGSGADTIIGGGGADKLSGAGGNDAFYFNRAYDSKSAQIDGGDGVDAIVFSESTPSDSSFFNTLAIDGSKAKNVEYLTIDTDGGVLNIDGTQGGTLALNLDASKFVTGLTIVGNAGSNILTSGKGADIFYGGRGDDTFAFDAGATGDASKVANDAGLAAKIDAIMDFNAAPNETDKIDFKTNLALSSAVSGVSGGATINSLAVADVSSFSGLLAQAKAVALSLDDKANGDGPKAGEVAFWKNGADSYIFVSDGKAGKASAPLTSGDVIIKVAGADITANNEITVTDGNLQFARAQLIFTTGADTLTGTSGDDVFTATLGTGATLTNSDAVDGAAGTDQLNLAVTGGSAASFPTATLANIENFYINDVNSGGASTYNFANTIVTGEAQVWSDRSTQAVTFNNLGTGTVVGLNGDGSIALGAVAFSMVSATDPVSIAIANGVTNAPTITNSGANPTTASIASTGAANKVGVVDLGTGANVTALTIDATTNLTATLGADFAASAALTVKGAAASVDLSGAALVANLTTIDASGLTAGGLTATLNPAVTSFKGGLSNDAITVTTITGSTAGAIDAGAGTADLLINTSTELQTAANGAKFANFEILRNQDTADADVSNLTSLTSLEAKGDGAGFLKMNATQAGAITNLIDNTATPVFSLATATGTSDILTITLKNATSTASADLKTATVTGFEFLNLISSSGSSADINKVTFTAGADLTKLSLSGAFPIDITLPGTVTNALAVDASSLTFNPGTSAFALTLDVNNALIKGSSVLGSSAADSITANTTAVTGGAGDFITYTTGAGDDAITSTLAAINNTSSSKASLQIDGGNGTDTLTLTDGSGLTFIDNNAQYLTHLEAIKYTVANQAISFTGGASFDANFKTSGVTLTLGDATNTQVNLVNLGTFTGNAAVALTATAATTQNQTISTGSGSDTVTLSVAGLTTGIPDINTGGGNDSITLTLTALTTANPKVDTGAGDDTVSITTGASWTSAQGVTNISLGSGNDTFTITPSGAVTLANAITVDGGAGKDSITFGSNVNNITTASEIVVKVHAGESTTSAYDSITGFDLADGTNFASTLDFDNKVLTTYAATAPTGFTSAELTVAVSAVGLVTFAGTSAATLTLAEKIAAVQSVVVTTNGDTALFVDGSNAYVFNNDSAGDSVVELVGQSAATTLLTVNATTANSIFIA
jgi:Ca2+-binding RTX toxin-like protein